MNWNILKMYQESEANINLITKYFQYLVKEQVKSCLYANKDKYWFKKHAAIFNLEIVLMAMKRANFYNSKLLNYSF